MQTALVTRQEALGSEDPKAVAASFELRQAEEKEKRERLERKKKEKRRRLSSALDMKLLSGRRKSTNLPSTRSAQRAGRNPYSRALQM